MAEPRPFRFGLTAKNAVDVKAWRQLARRAEGAGYSTLFVGDHIRNQFSPLVGLTVAAEATTNLIVGTNVLNVDLRNPIVLAQEVATLDVVSGGRVELGLGAGYSTTDYDATGISRDPASVRIERLREAVQVMKQYFHDGMANYEGRHYRIKDAQGFPRPFSTPWPRICIGGGGPKVLAVAGQEADIVSVSPKLGAAGLGPEAMAGAGREAFLERIGWLRDAAGERFDDIELHVSILFGGVGKLGREVIAGLGRDYGLTEQQAKALPIVLAGDVGEICERLHELRETYGISYVSVNDLDGFAPVVAKLAGQPRTIENLVSAVKAPLRTTVKDVKRRLGRLPAPAPPTPAGPRHKVLMIGAGGMGEIWIRKYLPMLDDRCEIHALVDVSPDPLQQQGDLLRVPEERRFRSMSAAFEAVRSGRLEGIDACFVVVPPAFHREAVESAAACGLDILCEKPLAGTWDDCVATYKSVKDAGVRLQVVQNYRFLPHIEAAKATVASGVVGPLNYIVNRFTSDYRIRNSWGAPFRHEMAHTLLLEAAAHHLDQGRNLAGADFVQLHALDWLPESSDGFDGECYTLVIGSFDNGVRYSYEGSVVAAGKQRSWGFEHYRLECADGAVVVTDESVAIHRKGNRVDLVEEVPVTPSRWTRHPAVLRQFFDWIDGGPEAATSLDDNIATAAAVFGAIASAESGNAVDVHELVSALRG